MLLEKKKQFIFTRNGNGDCVGSLLQILNLDDCKMAPLSKIKNYLSIFA